jgi:hypothetical protein
MLETHDPAAQSNGDTDSLNPNTRRLLRAFTRCVKSRQARAIPVKRRTIRLASLRRTVCAAPPHWLR